MRPFFEGLAPDDLIKQDLSILRSYERLDTTEVIEELIFVQSVEGRSHNGSGAFSKRTYVNTTVDDVVKALGQDPRQIKQERQKLIDDIAEFVTDTLHERKRDRLINASGAPFLGVPFFRDRKVNARDILRGLYLGGLRDNPDIRKETESRYQVTIGCGECHLVDTKVMDEMGLDGERLAHEAHEEKITSYIEGGLIVQNGMEESPDLDGSIRYYYVRHRLGPGQSDDAAIVAAGILYNPDVALGVFLADAIDTLEKYAPFYKDQDQELAYYIGRGFKDLKVSKEDVYEMAYLSAIPQAQEELVPDSSLRYLLSVDPRTNRTALQTHLAFIEGRPVAEIPISFKRITSTQFYEYMRRRLVNVRRLDALTLPEMSIEELSRPVGELVHKQFIVVARDSQLKDVIKKFRESKSEIVIVVDKNHNVVGTLSATDLIHLAR